MRIVALGRGPSYNRLSCSTPDSDCARAGAVTSNASVARASAARFSSMRYPGLEAGSNIGTRGRARSSRSRSVGAVAERIDRPAVGARVLAAPGPVGHREPAALAGEDRGTRDSRRDGAGRRGAVRPSLPVPDGATQADTPPSGTDW